MHEGGEGKPSRGSGLVKLLALDWTPKFDQKKPNVPHDGGAGKMNQGPPRFVKLLALDQPPEFDQEKPTVPLERGEGKPSQGSSLVKLMD